MVIALRRRQRRRAKTLTFSNISVITEDIYLELKTSCSLSKGEPITVEEVILQFFFLNAATSEGWHPHAVLLFYYVVIQETVHEKGALTLKGPITTAADDNYNYFFIFFFRENKT